ncbi:hypothetical protein DL98DRAFT_441278, partial [Cadophora sp. DSE1049]
QDNNIVLVLNNIYTIYQVDDFKAKLRRRLIKILTNGRIVRLIFNDEYIKELYIPRFINDYNYYIKGVDLANQFKEVYKTYKIIQRNWWPLYY